MTESQFWNAVAVLCGMPADVAKISDAAHFLSIPTTEHIDTIAKQICRWWLENRGGSEWSKD